ncbi:MAG: ABC transporter substrate-binding protein [Nitrospinota bacterium]
MSKENEKRFRNGGKAKGMNRRTFLRATAGVGGGVLGASLLPGLFRPKRAWAQKVTGPYIRIGVAQPRTGVFSFWAKKNLIALELAVKKINDAGGIGGVPVKLFLEDTGSKPAEAANVVRKLIEDEKVLAVLGPFSSSSCEVAFPIGVKMATPMLSQASSKPGVSKANRPYSFRTNVDEFRQALRAVPKFREVHNIKTAAVVYDVKEAVTRVLGERVLPGVAKKVGIRIVNPGDFIKYHTRDFDFSAQVTKLRGMKFDGILFGGVAVDAVTFLKQARRMGVGQPIVGGSPLIKEDFPVTGGKDVNGTIAPATFWPSMPRPGVAEFVAAYRKRAAAKKLPPDPVVMDVNIYDEMMLIAHLISKAGITNNPKDLAGDREKLMKGLSATRDYAGLAGRLGFNEDGDALRDIFVLMAKDGKWVKV